MWIKLPIAVFITAMPVLCNAGGAANTEQHKRAQDDYYADDLYKAISEAKVRTHHYDYSNEHRYDRTTSQSIQFPRMLNNELDNQVIETPALGGMNEDTEENNEGLDVARVNMLQDNDKLNLDANSISAPAMPVSITPINNANISINVTPR